MSVRTERIQRRRNIIKNVIIFVFTFLAILLFFHFIRFPVVNGTSMVPTYNDGDVLVTLYTNRVEDNDIAVLWTETLGEYVVKRVIGVEGDHIQIKDGQLFRNGARLYESYLNSQSWADMKDNVDIIVPEGQIFVMGDNRNDSTDSRILGMFSLDDIFGRVLWRLKQSS